MQTIGEEEVPTGVYVIKVQNSVGYVLPSTGGPGTRLFKILGLILITGAGLLLLKKPKLFKLKNQG